MDFPKRIQQHKSQSDSFAILLYKLRELGVFRSATENDYGIDFEIELVLGERVIGRYLKAQVKSAEDLYVRADGQATVGGIKQSTLLYWTELSYRTHVIVFAVDLKTEEIYFTKSVFWQATTLLDGSDKSKSIAFMPAIDLTSIEETLKLAADKKLLGEKSNEKLFDGFKNYYAVKLIQQIAFSQSIVDVIYAHKLFLRNIYNIYEIYTSVWHYDGWTEVQYTDVFRTVIECGKLLIEERHKEGVTEEEFQNIFNFDYWSSITGWGEDEISNDVAKKPLKYIIPLLFEHVKFYSKMVLQGANYWLYKDASYLKLVFKTTIPNYGVHDDFIKAGYDHDSFENKEHFDMFVYDVKEKAKNLKEKRVASKNAKKEKRNQKEQPESDV